VKTSDLFRFRGFEIFSLVLVSIFSLLGFFWPFFASADDSKVVFWIASNFAFLLLLTLIGRAKFDPKSLALLAVLSAIIAALRPLGAGAAGIEPMWFLLILSSYIFGASFGFLLGAISMLLSAFLTGGFGPWLPYQVFAAAWVGFLAGSLSFLKNRFAKRSQKREKLELLILAAVSMLLAELFGILMDLQFWPFALGPKTQLSYIPGAAVLDNLNKFLVYHATSSMAWNVPRAIFTALLILFIGASVLNALKRAARKANFASEIHFT